MWKNLLGGLLLVAMLAGCATTSGNPRDPLEGFNRAAFGFNEALDKTVLKPVAKGYRAVLPDPVRTGVTNFFANIGDLWIGVNNLLQGKVVDGVGDFARFIFNTTFGLFGLIDIASDAGLEKHDEDFGQTLGSWGVRSGPFLVLPILGPSTVRDASALALDLNVDPVWNVDNVPLRNSAVAVRFVDRRANLLDAGNLLEDASLDKYSFMRDAYLQRRRSLIYDGNPPREPEEGATPEDPSAAAVPNQPSPELSQQQSGMPPATPKSGAAVPAKDANTALPASATTQVK